MILFCCPAKVRSHFLKQKNHVFRVKITYAHTKGRLLNSKHSHLTLLKRLFWATNEDDLLGCTRNLLLAVKALPPPPLFPTSVAPQSPLQARPWAWQWRLPGAAPRFRGFAGRWRSDPAWGMRESAQRREPAKRGVQGVRKRPLSGHKLLVCLPTPALLSAGVFRFVLAAFVY